MVPKVTSQVDDAGQILSEVTRSNFYQYITQAFILGAFLNFATQYVIYRAPFKSVAELSLLILLTAFIVYLINQLKVKSNIKEALLSIIMVVMLPFGIINYINTASVTVWSIAFIMALLSIVFNNKRLLILVGSSTVLTLLWVWIVKPEQPVIIQSTDHFSRIAIFGIFLWIALYINRVFLQRILEKDEQVALQRLLSQVSTSFVAASEINIDIKINEVLSLLGKHFKIDRAHINFFANYQNKTKYSYEWCNSGINSIVDEVDQLSLEDSPSWMNLDGLVEDGIAHIAEVSALPETSPEKGWLSDKQIKSIVVLPLMDKIQITGLLCLDSIKSRKMWSSDNLEILKIIAHNISDIWLKIEAEKEIKHMAYYDALTDLPNRTLLMNRINQAIDLATRTEKLILIVFIDIDNLKAINDTMGHDGGDELLIQMAGRLSGCMRKYDTVSRFGGDEYVILIPQISRFEDVHKIADKIMRVFDEPIKIKNQEFFITASVGMAVFPLDGETTEELIKNADLAMFTSKESGKNRYTLCSSDMKKEFFINMELTNSLYRVLERDELILHYQPKIISTTEEIVGLEALVRWQHSQKGIIPPDIFIPIAEKNGQIIPIGHWVLQKACRQNKIWQDEGMQPVRMAVNLSLGQFLNKKLVKEVADVLEETGLDPAYLELEITESIAIHDPENTIKTLNELKELGVSISIDDFGTEYSSLSRLKTLPIDRIKLDMQFIHGISQGSKEEGIIKVIIQLARTLNLKVTAEGVETQEQLEFLKNVMCDEIQGFYFYKPMPVDDVKLVLKNARVYPSTVKLS